MKRLGEEHSTFMTWGRRGFMMGDGDDGFGGVEEYQHEEWTG